MTQSLFPTYTALQSALADFELHPSEAHGLIAGVLCRKEQDMHAWSLLVSDDRIPESAATILNDLYVSTQKQLTDFLFEFDLILPVDDETLPERAEALTLWCQGFLTGLKLIGVQVESNEKTEMHEAINDLIEIAKMNYEEVVPSEEDEAAYIELIEYVRMAVILIYQDLHGDSDDVATLPPSLH